MAADARLEQVTLRHEITVGSAFVSGVEFEGIPYHVWRNEHGHIVRWQVGGDLSSPTVGHQGDGIT